MIERLSTLWLVILLAGLIALLPTGTDPVVTGAAVRASGGSVSVAPAASVPASGAKLEITGAAFAYCNFDEECPQTRVIRIGKSPMQFVVVTQAAEELLGKEIEVGIELRPMEGEPLFETGFTIGLRYASQRSSLLYKRQPDAVARLEPGQYRYRVTVMTADGDNLTEWARVVVAQK